MKRYYTIGMAGHIDHGKTTLTNALTGVNTDRLKEEQERSITIELGYAPFVSEEDLQISIVDVPGHERFIRQMIAGVAGIDLVILVIAGDEGVMPQTKEHLDILSLLGIQRGVIAVTKIDQVDDDMLELVVHDIKENVQSTFLHDAPIFFVDSFSKKGIEELKEALIDECGKVSRKESIASFRLPIDQVFTVKGQGTVVRGTVYNGKVNEGDRLKVFPLNKEVRVRQIQVHHQQAEEASAGQRTALNIGGITYEEVKRGDVLVNDDFFTITDRIDVAFQPLKEIDFPIRQRQPIKLYIGTAEVNGKIVFFDRNEVKPGETAEVLCQLQLSDQVVAARGDRLILRKPTPAETMGGGWIIDPKGKRYRFGQETIERMRLKMEGTAQERIEAVLTEKYFLSRSELAKEASVDDQEIEEVMDLLLPAGKNVLTLRSIYEQVTDDVTKVISDYHEQYPMRIGIGKAELMSKIKHRFPEQLIEYVFETLLADQKIKMINQHTSLFDVKPSVPKQWATRLGNLESDLIRQGVSVENWSVLLNKHQIPEEIQRDYFQYVTQVGKAYQLDDDLVISKEAVEQARKKLMNNTNREAFTLQQARESLQVTRKYLVPLLELFDRLQYTKREDNIRVWL